MRPKFLAASKMQFMMCCRASSVWARRMQSSISKQQFSDELLSGFRVSEEMLKVEQTVLKQM